MKRVLAIVSGGLDSVTLVYYLRSLGHELGLLSFYYRQRHAREIGAARKIAERLGVPWRMVDISAVAAELKGSALTDPEVPVPDGEYAYENIAQTVVPNRNVIMLSIAFGAAMAQGYDAVAYAAHAGDHAVYPDTTTEFADAYENMQRKAQGPYWNVELMAPFVHMTKAEIVRLGHRLGVPFEDTWSCYKGEDVHCGTCSTCLERKSAFRLANVPDPTRYAQ